METRNLLAYGGGVVYPVAASMPESYPTPRRFPRVKVHGSLPGQASLQHDITLLDLSEGGARLEHAGRFSLNAICFVRLPTPTGELLLKGKIVHSAVSRTIPGPDGEPTLYYQTGIEFVEVTSESLQALRQLLASPGNTPPA